MILYRPVGLTELHLIAGSGFRAFPPRLAGQDFFYPVLEQSYAQQIARDWNTKDTASGYAGFVTQFELPGAIVGRYRVQTVGASEHRELWIPAAHLLELNLQIVGKISVVDVYTGPEFKGAIDPATKLPIPPSPSQPFVTVYRLKNDPERIRHIQRATLTTKEFGIEPTHGLVGSDDWWGQIERGALALQTVRGQISRVYMASMNDWPEFELRSEDGTLSQWTRESNALAFGRYYSPGRRVEIDYVIQHHRRQSFDGGGATKVVIEIRVSDDST